MPKRRASRAIRHYVIGNIATSVFAAVVVFVALSLLHVPAALLLAVLAGVCDFVPVLGFIVSALPAILLALTVSTGTAIATAAVYLGYHLAENYAIGPLVCGGQLRLSNLVALLAFCGRGQSSAESWAPLLALPVARCIRSWKRSGSASTSDGTRGRNPQTPGAGARIFWQ